MTSRSRSKKDPAGETLTSKILRTVRQGLRLNESVDGDGPAPVIEALEPRVLLSANPFAEFLKNQTENPFLNDNQSVIYMPAQAGLKDAGSLAAVLPSAEIISPAENAYLKGIIDVKGILDAGEAGLSQWTVKLVSSGGSKTYTLASGRTMPASEQLVSFSAGSYGAGEWTLLIEVTDQDGNIGRTSRNFMLDVAAPTVVLGQPAANARLTGTVEITGSIADADTADELISWALSLKNNITGEITVISSETGSRTNAVLGTFAAAGFVSGDYTLILDAWDAAGNARSLTRAVRIDGIAPEVSVSADVTEVDSYGYVTFTIDAADDIGVSIRRLIINGVTYNVASNGIARIRMIQAGVWDVVAEAVDAAGNVGRAVMTVTVNDHYAPEVSFYSVANNASLGSVTEITARIRDYDSPSLSWRLTLTSKTTGEVFVLAENPALIPSGGLDTVSLCTLTPSDFADDEYFLTLEAEDSAGHTGRTEISIKLDSTPPVIDSVSMDRTAVETFNPVRFTIHASDNFAVARYELYINGEKVAVGSNGLSSGYTFQEAGIYTIEAYAFDAAGNSHYYTYLLEVTDTPDVAAPVITINSPALNSAHSRDAAVRVTIRDADSLEINWTVKLIDQSTGREIVLSSGDRAINNQLIATLALSDYSDGLYTIVVEAVDRGGNRSAVSQTFAIDTVPPEVTVKPETSRLESGQVIWFNVHGEDASAITRRTLTINGRGVALDANGRGSYTFAEPGEYTITATVTDAAGNVGTLTYTVTVGENTDLIAPSVSITSPEAHSYHGGLTVIRGTIADIDSETVTWTVRLRYPNGTTTRVLGTGSGMITDGELASFSAASYAAGLYTIEVEAVDPAGNTTVASREIYIDRSATAITLSGPANNAYVGQPTAVTGLLNDVDSPVGQTRWVLTVTNTATGEVFVVASGTGNPADGVFGIIDPVLYSSATYTMKLEATDAGGNVSSLARTLRVDGVAPTVSVSADVTEVDSYGYVTFTIDAADDIGVSSRRLIINGVTYNVASNGIARIRMIQAGVWDVVAEAVDAAGNVGRAVMTVTVNDHYAPEVSFYSVTNNASLGSVMEITARIRDYDSPSLSWRLTLTSKTTGEVFVLAENPALIPSGGMDTVSLCTLDPSDFADDEYFLTLEAEDSAGNTGRTEISIKLDSTPPVIDSVSMDRTAVETFNPVRFTIHGSDNFAVARYELYINGDKVAVGSNGLSSAYTFQEAGIYTIEAYAFDAAGNSHYYTYLLEVTDTPDVAAPVITINSPALNSAHSRDAAVRVTIRDADSLEINWTVKLIDQSTGREVLLGSGDRAINNQLIATLALSEYSDGLYTIVVEAVDRGGNRSISSHTFAIDTAAPEVTVTAESSRLESGQVIWFNVHGEDASAITRRTLTINGRGVSLDANGRGSYTFAEPGEYTITATVTDAAGNVGTVTYIVIVTANTDLVAPDVTITSPEAHSYHGGLTVIRGTIADIDSETVTWTVRLRYPNGTTTRVLGTGSGMITDGELASFSAASYAAGLYTIEVEAVDPAGNTTVASREIYIDRSATAITLSGPANNAYVGQPTAVTGLLNDIDSPVGQTRWVLTVTNTATGEVFVVASGTGNPADGVFGIIDPVLYSSATYTMKLEATDAGGNISSLSRSLRIDGVAPEVRVSADVTEVDSYGYVTFTIDASDDIGVSSRRLIINGVTYNVAANGIARIRMIQAGAWDVVAEAVDAAGNVGRAVMTVTVNDHYAPEVSFYSVANNASLGSVTEITARIRDYDSPSLSWRLTLTSKTTGEIFVLAENPALIPSGGMDTVSLCTLDPSNFADDEYFLTLEAEDSAGNTGRTEISIRLDSTPPVIDSVSMDRTAVETFNPVRFTIHGSDNFAVSRYELYINGDKVAVGSNGLSSGYTFQEAGIYTIEAYAFDASGNSHYYTYLLEVTDTPDIAAPVITINSPALNSAHSRDAAVRVTIRDADSLEINWTVKLIDQSTGREVLLGSGDRAINNQLIATLNIADYADGMYTIVVEAVDRGGNRSTSSHTFAIDTAAPEVTVTAESSRLESGQVIWFNVHGEDASAITRRTLTINGRGVALDANGRGSYTFAEPGEYTITATVTDAAGNVGTLTYTVTVGENTDLIAPSVSITSPEAHSYHGGLTVIRGTIADIDSETVTWTVRLRYPNGTTTRVLGTGSGMITDGELASFSAASYAAGLYTIEVEAVDPAGNITVASREIYIDRSATAITLSGPANNAYVGQPTAVTGLLSDVDSPVGQTRWVLTVTNTATGEVFVVASGTGNPADGVFGIIDPVLYSSATYTMKLEATDAGGNVSSLSRSLRIDGVAPEVRVSADVTEVDSYGYVTFTIDAADDIGVSIRRLIINGVTYNVASNGIARIRMTQAGVWDVVAEAVDAAGNVGRAVMTVTVNDHYAPEVSFYSVANNASLGSVTEITARIRDYDSPSLSWRLTLTSKTTGEVFVLAENPALIPSGGLDTVSLCTLNPSDFADDEYFLTLEAEDSSGHTGRAEISIKLDSTPPVIDSVSMDRTAVETFNPVRFTIHASDNFAVARYELYINGDKVAVGSNGLSSAYTFQEAGINTIEAYAFDAAGNSYYYTYLLEVTDTPDVAAPVITINSPVLNSAHGRDIAVRVTVKDADSLEINWTVKLIDQSTGREVLLGSGDRAINNQLIATLALSDYSDGLYTIVVEAVDRGGNRSAVSQTFAVDTVPPEVTVKPETSRLESGQVIWFNVHGEDASSIVRRTLVINGRGVSLDANGRGSYTFAEPGEYTITATATDAAGNMGTVTYTVIVTANTDLVAPEVMITSPEAHSYHGGLTVIRGTIADIDSETVTWTVRLRYPNGTTTRVLGTGSGMITDGELASFSAASYAAGLYTIEVEAVDPAGNTTTAVQEIYIDRAAPALSISGPTANSLLSEPAAVTGALNDHDTPLDRVTWTLTITDTVTGDVHILAAGSGMPADGTFGIIDPRIYPSGTYKITLEAVDAGGNTASVSRNIRLDGYIEDTEPPAISVDHDAPSSLYAGQTVNFTVTATDNIGVVTLIFTVNGQQIQLDANGGASFVFEHAGIYVITATALDAAGNAGTYSMTFEVVTEPDTEAPAVQIRHNAPDLLHPGQAVDFYVEAADNVGVVSRALEINGRSVPLDAAGHVQFIFDTPGKYTIIARAYDAAGNEGVETLILEVTAAPDTEKPVVSLSHNAPADLYPGQTVEFAVKATDNVGVVSMTLEVNGQPVTLDASGKASVTLTEAGTYTIIARAYDAAGNEGIETLILEVTAAPDTEKPVVSLSHNAPADLYPGQTVEFAVKATDNVGVVSMTLEVNGQPVTLDASGKASVTLTEVGTYTIIARAYDAAGNEGIETLILEVTAAPDTEKPVVKLTHNAPADLHPGQPVEFTVKATDNVGVVSMTLEVNGQPVMLDASGKASVTLTEVGTYTIIARAYDAAGNEGIETLILEVTAAPDTEKPVVKLTHNAPADLHPGQPVEFTVKATDNVGVVSMTLEVNGQPVMLDASGKASVTLTEVGTYTIIARAYDAAGNEGIETLILEVTAAPDTEKPVVKLTHNAPADLHPGQSVEFTVKATDNVGVVSMTLEVNGQPVTLDASGKASVTLTEIGTYTIIARAYDAAGNEGIETLILEVTAAPDTEKPVVKLTHNAPADLHPGQSVEFTVKATDNVGVVSMKLEVNGQPVTLDASGKASVTLTEVGTYTIIARAYDAAGNEGIETLILEVTAAPNTEKPVVSMTHNAPADLHPGQSVEFTVKATDNVGVVSMTLEVNGQPVMLDASGKASVTLTEIGTYTIIARAYDAAGNEGIETLILEVTAAPDTEKPVVSLTHNAPADLHPGQTVEFTVKATDNVGVVSITLEVNGQPVTLNANGKVSVTLTETGTYTIIARAYDAAGNEGISTVTLEVTAAADTEKPVVSIAHDGASVITRGRTVIFAVTAADNVGVVSTTFEINGRQIALDADGRAAFTFTETGTYTITARAWDAAGNEGTRTIILEVTDPAGQPDYEKPVIDLQHNLQSGSVKEGQQAVFTVSATDNVAVARLGITVNGEELVIDGSGQAVYTFGGPGLYVVVVTAADTSGNEAVRTEVFSVDAPVTVPDLWIDVMHSAWNPTNLEVGEVIEFEVEMSESAVRAVVYIVDASPGSRYMKEVELDADGRGRLVLDRAGTFYIYATAWDAYGNSAEDQNYYGIRVYDNDWIDEAPDISFGGHFGQEGQAGHRVEKSTDIIASITGDVASWELYLVDNRTGIAQQLAVGTGEVHDAVLGHIDVTALSNGSYTIRIKAMDSWEIAKELTKEITIASASATKLGNFSLPFQDLNVSVGGFNIQLNRTYDSLNTGYIGDFGCGWNLSTLPIQASVNHPMNVSEHPMGPTISFYPESGWDTSTVIDFTMPDGRVVQFDMNMDWASFDPWTGLTKFTMSFSNISGGPETLRIEGYGNCHEHGAFVAQEKGDGSGYYYVRLNADTGYFNPTRGTYSGQQITYELTLEDGTTYIIDPTTGKAVGMRAADGRSLEITDNGITARDSGGSVIEEVKYIRDAMGRITAVIDPAGAVISYAYNDSGDLISVTSRGGEKTTYEYVDAAGAPGHYLQTIRDNSGKAVISVDYDFNTGRIRSITDANGNTTSAEYTLYNSEGVAVEKVTDAMGLVTEYVTDAGGNVIRTIYHVPDPDSPDDPSRMSYMISIADYDTRGYCLGTARMFTVTAAALAAAGKDRFEYWPDDVIWESLYVYDEKGHCISSTDVYGRTTTYEYDALGKLVRTTDPDGKVTSSEYDGLGKIIHSADAYGNITQYEYNLKGQLVSVTLHRPDGSQVVMSRYELDAGGNILRSYDRYGNETRYVYNADGVPVRIIRTIIDPATRLSYTTEDFTEYDANGRMTRTGQYRDDILVYLTEYEYDSDGNMTAETDKYGLRTEYTYDAKGRLVATHRQGVDSFGVTMWTVTRIVYDEFDREIWRTDDQFVGDWGSTETTRGTRTIYDHLGRAVRTEVWDGVLIYIEPDGSGSSVWETGSLISYSARGFDGSNQLAWTENTYGIKTVYVYTREGALSHTIIDLDGDLSTTDDQFSTDLAVYDDAGRVVGKITDRDGDLGTTGDQSETRYEYDEWGRVTHTRYADGTWTSFRYDALGRKVWEADQGGYVTRYEYDSDSRLTAVILDTVKHPVTGELVHVRYEYVYDERGNQTVLRDNLWQTDPDNPWSVDRSGMRETLFEYDLYGRQTSRTLPDGSQEFFFYNEQGQQIRHVSFEGRVTVTEYDPYGRVSARLYYTSLAAWNTGNGTASQTRLYTYDARGRVVKEVDSALGTTVTEYNAEGRVSRIASPAGVINYEYDAVSGQITRTWTGPDSASPVTDIRYTYDSFGRLETVTTYSRDGEVIPDETARYVYDLIGNLSEIHHANGVISEHVYDLLNRLTSLTHAKDGDVLQRYEYEYYADGNKSGEYFIDSEGNVRTWEWLYDAIGRLVRESHGTYSEEHGVVYPDYTTDYKYDLVGNRLEKSTDTDGDGIADEVIVSEYDLNDRLLNELTIFNGISTSRTEYFYNITEQTGKRVTNLLTDEVTSETVMEYNDLGRMTKITITTYTDGAVTKTVTQEYEYDSSGLKIRETETVTGSDGTIDSAKETGYLYDKQNHTGYAQVIEETEAVEGEAVTVTTYTIGHAVLSQYSSKKGYLSLLTDGHGSTRAAADADGKVKQEYSYDAYGNALGFDTSDALTNILYSGQQTNPASGLQYLRNRWYNPQSGTFNRLDPFSGNKNNPQSFHKYAYGHNNPIRNYDPSGNNSTSVTNGVMMAHGTPRVTTVHTWGADEIDRFNKFQYLIKIVQWIGDDMYNTSVPENYRERHEVFKEHYRMILKPAIVYQQQNYSHYTSWRFTQPGEIGSEQKGINILSPKIAHDVLMKGDAAGAIVTLIHEPQHNFSQHFIGHSRHLTVRNESESIAIKKYEWESILSETMNYITININNTEIYPHLQEQYGNWYQVVKMFGFSS